MNYLIIIIKELKNSNLFLLFAYYKVYQKRRKIMNFKKNRQNAKKVLTDLKIFGILLTVSRKEAIKKEK